jgi:hypothetical protein
MALSLKNILHQNKTKVKQNAIAGLTVMTMMMMVMILQCLIPRAVAGVIDLLHVLQDDVHRSQDVASDVRILGNPRDRRRTKILQDLGHGPHPGRQSAGLDKAVRLGILMKPLELDQLHQLITIVPRIEPLGLHIHQRHHTQPLVYISLIELNLLRPQNLVMTERLLSVGGVSLYLFKVLLPSSLDLGPLCVKGGTNLSKGFLGNPRLHFPSGMGILPSHELLFPCKEQFLQLLNHCSHRGRARRWRRRKRPTQSTHGQINNASRNSSANCTERPKRYLPAACTIITRWGGGDLPLR